MIYCFRLSVIALIWVSLAAAVQPLYLLEEWSKAQGVLPRNFRMMNRASNMRASGSGQFSYAQLKQSIKHIGEQAIIIVDLRQESHGFINGGQPVFWYQKYNTSNIHKSLQAIEQDERIRLDGLKNKHMNYVYTFCKHKQDYKHPRAISCRMSIACTRTEADLAAQEKVKYIRFAIRDAHAPSPQEVDRFICFIKRLPARAWLHMHCSAGRGRTTTFLAMYDSMLNGHKVPLEDIIQRQYQSGGINILDIPEQQSWKHCAGKCRAQFIKHFYHYCQEQYSHNFAQSWSSWLQSHKS